MKQPQLQTKEWSPCPPETLMLLSSALKRRQRWNRLQRIVTISAAVMIIAAAGGYVISQILPQTAEKMYAGISCHEVSQSLPDFIAGTVDEKQRMKIEAHLQLCSSCRRLESQLRVQQHASANERSANELRMTSLVLNR